MANAAIPSGRNAFSSGQTCDASRKISPTMPRTSPKSIIKPAFPGDFESATKPSVTKLTAARAFVAVTIPPFVLTLKKMKKAAETATSTVKPYSSIDTLP